VTGTPHRPQNGINRRLNSPQSNDESAGLKRSTRTSRDKSSRSRFIFPCIWLSGRFTSWILQLTLEPSGKQLVCEMRRLAYRISDNYRNRSPPQGKVAGSKNEMSQTDKRLYKPRIAKCSCIPRSLVLAIQQALQLKRSAQRFNSHKISNLDTWRLPNLVIPWIGFPKAFFKRLRSETRYCCGNSWGGTDHFLFLRRPRFSLLGTCAICLSLPQRRGLVSLSYLICRGEITDCHFLPIGGEWHWRVVR